jgi:gas vesicle protein
MMENYQLRHIIKTDEMKDREDIITAFVFGVAAGVVAGLLFAPYKGSKTRRIIADYSDHLSDDLIHKAEEGLSAIKDLKESFIAAAKSGKEHHN